MLLHYESLYVMPIKHRKLKHWEREGQRDWQRMKEFWLIMFPNWQTGDINLPLCEILLYEVPMHKDIHKSTEVPTTNDQ